MKIFCYFFLVLSIFGSNRLQEKDDKIRWNKELELDWSHFRAKPERTSSYAANTHSGISYDWSYSNISGVIKLEHRVSSNFYPDHSWVKPEFKNDKHLLEHERLHFDISELHARKLRKRLGMYEPGKNFRQELKKIYNQVEKQRREMQQRFDEETRHSENLETELSWRKYVKDELEKLNVYAI